MSRKVKSRLTVALVFILCCVVIGAFLYAQLNLKEKNHKADLFTLVPTISTTCFKLSKLLHTDKHTKNSTSLPSSTSSTIKSKNWPKKRATDSVCP